MSITPIPFKTDFLEEQDGHKVFFSQYGNPHGEVIVVLHGGPGSRSKAKQVKGYDLEKYHVVTFDQRGCGKSEPSGKIEHNTIQDLVSDAERLRNKLKTDKWFVAGGSWGSTLALAYAQAHPNKVKGLLLSSIFLANQRDVEWAFTAEGGVDRFFPDVWEKRQEFLSLYKAKPNNIAKILLEKLSLATSEQAQEIAAGVSNWEGNLMNAQEDVRYAVAEDMSEDDIASVKIYLHYEANNYFLQPNQILENMDVIKSIPTIIVHGRYDLLCPVEAAWKINQAQNNSELLILPTSNHKLTAEGEIARKLAYKLFLLKQ